jgi:uncharacterized protein (TIGR02186 family)
MRTMFRSLLLISSLFIFAPGLHAAQPSEDTESSHISIVPDIIHINAFYKGTDVAISADLPIDCDGAVVKIQGEDERITLKRKAKVYIFWLNVDDVTVSNAPDIYILNSTAAPESISAIEARRSLLLGYDALMEHIDFQGKNALSGSEFFEFIKLKEHNGSYQQNATAQLLPSPDKERNSFNAILPIPPAMPSGNHQVLLYYFRDRTLMGRSSATLRVEKVGLPNYLYSLAFDHPAFYGVFACVIAMAAGITMGLILGSRKRRKK